jgi:hypothetical protein
MRSLLLYPASYFNNSISQFKRCFFDKSNHISFPLVFISVAVAIVEKSYYKNERPAVVFAEMVEVKAEPQKLAANVVTLHEGTKVFVKETLEN